MTLLIAGTLMLGFTLGGKSGGLIALVVLTLAVFVLAAVAIVRRRPTRRSD